MEPTILSIAIVMLLAGGALIGSAINEAYNKKKLKALEERHLNALRRENDLHKELGNVRLEMDVLRGKHADVSDKFLEEVCEALEGDTIELPSFGIVDISTADGLKDAFKAAVDVDLYYVKE